MRFDPNFPYFITKFYVYDFVAPPGMFNTCEVIACILRCGELTIGKNKMHRNTSS
jgi:hypothetical protein